MDQDKIWDYYQNEKIDSFDDSFSRQNNLVKKFKRGNRVLNIGVGGGIFEKNSQQ